jgi:hypothetical protein
MRAQGRQPWPFPGPRLPQGAEAEAIAERGALAMSRAPTEAAARRALDEMLDALYGPKSDKSDTSEREKNRFMGSRNL